MTLVNRWYKIIDILVAQHKVEIDTLIQELDISQQTLLKSVAQLNDILDNDVEIVQKKNLLELRVYDYSRLESILGGSLRKTSDFNSSTKRIAYIIKRLVDSIKPLIIDDLAEEISVSRGTINKDLKIVKQIAKDFSLEILSKPNRGIEISGEELNLRLIYIHKVYSHFEIENINHETLSFLLNLFKTFKIPKKIQELLTKSISVAILRIKNNHHFDKPISLYSNEVKANELMEELLFYLEMNYQISLSQFEKNFINFPLNVQYIEGLSYSDYYDDKLFSIYHKAVERVKSKLYINFDEKILFSDIQSHLKYLINRLIFHFQINDIFHGEIRYKYPLAFEMANVASEVLEEEFGYLLQLSERSYLALYFEMVLREKNEIIKTTTKKIAVVCTTGRGTANMICRRLTQVLGRDIAISQFSEEDFNPELDDNYFAIFTTIPLKFANLKSPVVQITNLFDDQWLQNEWQRVNHFHQKNLETTTFKFLRLKPRETYQDYLKEMAKHLQETQLVDFEFEDRILKREEKQTTQFGNLVAFPHTINHIDGNIILMLGLLEEPFKGTNNLVEFIFMLAIPKTIEGIKEAELLELYDDIFRIAGSDSLKNELRKIDNEESFISFTKDREVF
ncbi:MAG: PRD domain-containing protein [Streptococcus parauberis]